MNISSDNLNRVKNAFEHKVEYGKVRVDSDFPFFNAYDWKGEILFSNGYRSYGDACQFADQSFYKDFDHRRNGAEERVKYLGALNTSRFFLVKR